MQPFITWPFTSPSLYRIFYTYLHFICISNKYQMARSVCQHWAVSSASPWIPWWKRWLHASRISSAASNPMTSRSPWWGDSLGPLKQNKTCLKTGKKWRNCFKSHLVPLCLSCLTESCACGSSVTPVWWRPSGSGKLGILYATHLMSF